MTPEQERIVALAYRMLHDKATTPDGISRQQLADTAFQLINAFGGANGKIADLVKSQRRGDWLNLYQIQCIPVKGRGRDSLDKRNPKVGTTTHPE